MSLAGLGGAGPDVAFNYRYVVDRARRATGPVLDYGCGPGMAVAYGRSQGVDIWGTDSFEGHYADNLGHVLPEAKDRVRRIDGGIAPFPDGSFAAVISNQVFEHTRDPERLIADIVRLLRPGGLLVCTYPSIETWYEGHIGLYFAHRLRRWPWLRRKYFGAAYRLGLGNYRDGKTGPEWTAMFEQVLDEVCFYHRARGLRAALERAFGMPATDLAADYTRARVGPRAARLPHALDPALRLVCHLRAGQILEVTKAAQA